MHAACRRRTNHAAFGNTIYDFVFLGPGTASVNGSEAVSGLIHLNGVGDLTVC